MSSLVIHQAYAGIAPWAALALLLMGRNPHPGLCRKVVSLLLATLVLFAIPINGWKLAAWIRVLEPNPSLTLTGLLLAALSSRLTGKSLFRRRDLNAAWIFGSAAAIVLYPMGLGLTRIDPYAWGWDRPLPLATALVAFLLLLRGNRFGVVLLLPFAGILLHLQESTNFWDAVMDPFYGAVSLIAILLILAARLFRPKGTSAREEKVPG
jgi:hypothetical protein